MHILHAGFLTWITCSFINVVYAQVAPKLAPLPRELEFRRGERFQLVCGCREGEPPLTFSWVRDGQPLVESAEVQVRRFDEFSSSVTVSALREDSAGNYTCIASNIGGSDSSTVRLRVLVPPTWIRQPYDMSVLSGARVTLNCETSGVPKPTVTWRRSRGFNLQHMETLSSSHWRTGDDGSLTTSSVVKDDEGFYSCEVANGVGEGLRKTVRLEVQVPPTVWAPESEKTVKKGDSAALRCEMVGDSPLTITWDKANRNLPLIAEDRIKIQEETTLENTSSSVIIRNTAAEDTGLYICSARNTYGQSQSTIRLSVVEQPSIPLDFQIAEVWCKSIRLKWRQPYNGNSPLRHYIIRYKIKDSKSSPTESRVPDSQQWAVIRDLRPRTQYSFQVLAVNDVGASGASSTLHATTAEEEPEAAPTNVHIKSKDSSGFLLSWKPPPADRWNGDLTGFSIGYKRVSHGSAQSLPFTYKVLPASLPLSSPGSSAPLEYHVRGLQESSSYTVVVQAMTAAGLGPQSEPVLVKTSYGESPQVPSVSLVSVEQTLITLKVEQNGKTKAPATQYTLHIREGNGHWVKIPLSPHSREYKVGGLLAGGEYKLYLTARNGYGDSGPSDVVTFRTEQESSGSSVFAYEEEDLAVPFYQRLAFIIPVAVSATTILVVPIAACCCLQKLSSLQAPKPDGVESRGFTYTPSGSEPPRPRRLSRRPRSLPPLPPPSASTSTSNPSEGHYSTLQNYESVIPVHDRRFSQFMVDNKLARQIVALPGKEINI